MHRKQGRPFFIDKMPNNFAHIGLIHLILPNARIVDARRDPMACGFSCFKQHFARGQGFAYDLADLGLYYRDYLDLMAWFDAVLPGRVHRVVYEDLIADPEAQVRRLLRLLRPAGSRRRACASTRPSGRFGPPAPSRCAGPIYTDSLESWRRYQAWLGPFEAALAAPVPPPPTKL
ncbi:MAG: sulfotransferase [Caulobacteraceae bacterium]